ncbi:hypothetical protein GCM10010253_58550 [Streptomyces badius]|uniref:Hydrolase n=1 Tax=Streptomyces badius TaxID=1941 RepID=A0ABQ2TNB2_STRBA|nr:hypothetical protein GCM10010253_58550 [Streptomyces badius]
MEDAPAGVQAAVAAGCVAVGLTTTHTEEALGRAPQPERLPRVLLNGATGQSNRLLSGLCRYLHAFGHGRELRDRPARMQIACTPAGPHAPRT